MARVVPAEGVILQRVIATTPLVGYRGFSREVFAQHEAARAKTALALRQRRRFALMQADLLASAERYDLTGTLDGQPLAICGIARVASAPEDVGVAVEDRAPQCLARPVVARVCSPAGRKLRESSLIEEASPRRHLLIALDRCSSSTSRGTRLDARP